MAGLDLSRVQPRAANPAPTRGSVAQLLTRDFSFSRKRLSDKQKETLYLELGMLLGAGVDAKTALDLQAQQHRGFARELMTQIRNAVVAGSPFSVAAQTSGQFSAYEYHSLRIGEETGRLVTILQELARYYKGRIKQRRQLIQALAYPVVVLCTAAGAVLFMLNFIVPMFSDVFQRFGGQLPPLTQAVVELSAALRANFWWGLATGAVLAAGGRLMGKVPTYRFRLGILALKLPVLGGLIRRVYLVRMCQSLALLTGAHVPLNQALELAQHMMAFAPLARALATTASAVLQGNSLHESLAANSLFDARMLALVKVGEEVNQLDHFFGILAAQYSDEVDHRAALLSSTLEPLIIIFLGLVVGVILVAMYLPIFQMSSAIDG